MAGKRLELVEKLVGQMIAEMGAVRFIIAVGNATSHGGALLANDRIDLDRDDVMLQSWHRGIDELRNVAKWMEGDESQAEYFLGQHTSGKMYGNKPRLSDRIGEYSLDQMTINDRTQHPIASVEHLVFELTGEKIQFLREKGDRKSTVLLRCGLAVFMNEVIGAMGDDHEFQEVVFAIAKCVAESGVSVNWKHFEYSCNAHYNRVKRVVVDTEEEEEEETDTLWYTNADTIEALVYKELGTMFHLGAAHHGADFVHLPVNEQTFVEVLQTFVRNQRSVGHVIDTFNDRFNLYVTCEEVNQRVVAGPGQKSLHPRVVRKAKAARAGALS
uniref:Uncharacterized protein n=1 Tax=Pseudomonas phage HRDY3 TaxID=3236930 RepID=A0AB39CEH7_9VIRU